MTVWREVGLWLARECMQSCSSYPSIFMPRLSYGWGIIIVYPCLTVSLEIGLGCLPLVCLNQMKLIHNLSPQKNHFYTGKTTINILFNLQYEIKQT